jgi:hypothetical protein
MYKMTLFGIGGDITPRCAVMEDGRVRFHPTPLNRADAHFIPMRMVTQSAHGSCVLVLTSYFVARTEEEVRATNATCG